MSRGLWVQHEAFGYGRSNGKTTIFVTWLEIHALRVVCLRWEGNLVWLNYKRQNYMQILGLFRFRLFYFRFGFSRFSMKNWGFGFRRFGFILHKQSNLTTKWRNEMIHYDWLQGEINYLPFTCDAPHCVTVRFYFRYVVKFNNEMAKWNN